MKKIIILTSIIIAVLFTASIEAYQTTKGSIQVTFKNGFNIVLDDGKINTFKNDINQTKEEYKIVNTYVTNSDNTVIDFNDGTSAVINHEQNIYEFYTPLTGDWELKVNNHNDLIKVLKTYLINNYNIEPTEVDDHNIFNDLNLSI